MHHFFRRHFISILVLCSGMAALSWEVLWQIKSTLALGVSAWGTAITLAITMGGMCIGALAMGQILRKRTLNHPLRLYGLLECVIGLAGFFLPLAFRTLENIDTRIYATHPTDAAWVHIVGIILTLGLPTLAMGATLPVLGLIGKKSNVSIAKLYGLNTLGAAAGTLLCAFVFIPFFGITNTIWTIGTVDIAIGCVAFACARLHTTSQSQISQPPPSSLFHTTTPLPAATAIVLVTGLATFMLEVAWFRSLTAAFMSTTDAFAIMLACVLLALGGGSAIVPLLKRSGQFTLGTLLAWAGFFILVITPIVERFDFFAYTVAPYPAIVFLQWFAITLYIIGTPMLLLGLALPWILDEQHTPRTWGTLYGLNALAAIAGAILAGWVFLPSFGFAATAWIAGGLVAITGLFVAPPEKRKILTAACMLALIVAISCESGVGRTRVQGSRNFSNLQPTRILESHEGPDATVTAAEYENTARVLFIDGFEATLEGNTTHNKNIVHYMPWMGHLPMIAHPDPKNALVICFGTGQTANAVRQENPASLDIVDINKNVLKLAHYFLTNENVLDDKRVKTTVMDGRAYMRRTEKMYDVITLEPMPPNFAGVNALYSQEFYMAAKHRLTPHGMIAQWLPFHLMTPYYSASIAKTFQSVFPNTVLWVDPPSGTGILLGSMDDRIALGQDWPGYKRSNTKRDLTENVVKDAIAYDRTALARYAGSGTLITDDNQLLAYGQGAYTMRTARERIENHMSFSKPRGEKEKE